MREERTNTRRPTSEASELPSVSRRPGDGERVDERSTSLPGASEIVAVRMHSDGLAALAEVQRHLGGNRSEVVRQAVQIVAEALTSSSSIDAAERSLTKLLAARRPLVINTDPVALGHLREGLREIADRYSQQTFQFQKIGNNWNQIAKVANSGAGVDADALRGVQRALDRLAWEMERDAKRDAQIAAKLREVA